jgi:hypothetical protein
VERGLRRFPQPQPSDICVYNEPIILPLNADGQIYALQDEQGRLVGTGTREICEALLTFMKNEAFLFRRLKPDQPDRNSTRP